jgi:hypothetical protein
MDEMRRQALKLWESFVGIFSEAEDPDEPFFDPVHLGAVCIACMAAIGGLYWLLWTLLVYEGGIFPKLRATLAIVFTGKTLKDFGYEAAPYAMGVFEGWVGNLIALVLTILLVGALHHLYRTAKDGATKIDA